LTGRRGDDDNGLVEEEEEEEGGREGCMMSRMGCIGARGVIGRWWRGGVPGGVGVVMGREWRRKGRRTILMTRRRRRRMMMRMGGKEEEEEEEEGIGYFIGVLRILSECLPMPVGRGREREGGR